MTDAKVCRVCGKRFMSPAYRRQHERSPFAHLTSEEYRRLVTHERPQNAS